MEKDFFFVEEKEKEDNIWRQKIFGPWRRRKRRKLFGEGKYFFVEEKKSREGEGGKYLVKEDNIFCG